MSNEGKGSAALQDLCTAYVKLISCDGHEFFIKKELALKSSTIKAMLSGPAQGPANEINEVNFRDIPSKVLKSVVLYFYFNEHFLTSPLDNVDFKIDKELALDLLLVASFLDI